MRLRHKLLVLAPAIALATAGLTAAVPGAASAGTGASTACNDNYPGGSEIHLLTSPITLEVESPDFAGGTLPTYLQVCYSTTSVGSTSTPEVGGDFDVYVAYPGFGTGAACASDPQSLAIANCAAGTNPSATFTPGPGGGGTFTLTIPIGLCFNTTVVPSGGCDSVSPSLNSTGVVVGTFTLTPPPPGYSTGAGFALSGLSVQVNGGTPVSLLGGSTQVGVNPAVVGAGTAAGSIPICLLSICVPGVWVGEQPISAASVVVDGIPVTIPPVFLGCVLNLNTSCPPPY